MSDDALSIYIHPMRSEEDVSFVLFVLYSLNLELLMSVWWFYFISNFQTFLFICVCIYLEMHTCNNIPVKVRGCTMFRSRFSPSTMWELGDWIQVIKLSNRFFCPLRNLASPSGNIFKWVSKQITGDLGNTFKRT